MKKNDQYFSLVKTRILELQEELEQIQKNEQDGFQLEKQQLQIEFLTKKIAYLSRLVDLPLYLVVSNLSLEQLDFINGGFKTSKELIQLLNLESIEAHIYEPKIRQLSYVKSAITSDFDSMTKLLMAQKNNRRWEAEKRSLYSGMDSSSFQYFTNAEKKLNATEKNMDETAKMFDHMYDEKTLHEVIYYKNNPQKRLSRKFILKHQFIVDPKMKKTVKGLTKGISRFLPFRRKKLEKAYLDGVMHFYQNNPILSTLNISFNQLFDFGFLECENKIKQARIKINEKKQEMIDLKKQVQDSKRNLLNQIHDYERKQANEKDMFAKVLHSKIDFLPNMFQDQLWNDPYLKDSFIREACYEEEQKLMRTLMEPLQEEKVQELFDYFTFFGPKNKVKNLSA